MKISLSTLQLSKQSPVSATENHYSSRFHKLQQIMQELHVEELSQLLGEANPNELVVIFAALLLDTSGTVKEYNEETINSSLKKTLKGITTDRHLAKAILKEIYDVLNGSFIEDKQEFSNITYISELIETGGFEQNKELICQKFCKRIIKHNEVVPVTFTDLAFKLFEIENVESQAKILTKLKLPSNLASSTITTNSSSIESQISRVEKPINIEARVQIENSKPVEVFLNENAILSLNASSELDLSINMILNPILKELLTSHNVNMLSQYFIMVANVIQQHLPHHLAKIYSSIYAVADFVCFKSNPDGAKLLQMLHNIIDERLATIVAGYSTEQKIEIIKKLAQTFREESANQPKSTIEPKSEIKSKISNIGNRTIPMTEVSYNKKEQELRDKARRLDEREKEIEARFEALRATEILLSRDTQPNLQQAPNIANTILVSPPSVYSTQLPPPPPPPPPPPQLLGTLGLSPKIQLPGSIPNNTLEVAQKPVMSMEDEIAKARAAMKSAQKPTVAEYNSEQIQSIRGAEELLKSPLNIKLWEELKIESGSLFTELSGFLASTIKLEAQPREISIIGLVKQIRSAELTVDQFKLIYQLPLYSRLLEELPQKPENIKIVELRAQLAKRFELLKTVITKFENAPKKTAALPQINVLTEKEIDSMINECLEKKGMIGMKLIKAKDSLKQAVNTLSPQAKTADAVKKFIMEKVAEIK